MLDINRNKNIHLKTLTEIQSVSGFVGNFEVEVLQRAKYTTSDCNGCGACVDVCPAYGASEFDQKLGTRKAIYIAFAQAVPMVAQIDMDKCIKCGLCQEACELKAVNFDDTDKVEKLKVGTIIVATGWDEFRQEGYLGYGEYPNVITQLELERILAPNGPTYGNIIRPSDGKHPHKILFIQCVGSRDLKRNKHCSSGVCCLISIKNTKLIKQHDANIDVTVAFIDIRAGGKAYEEYYLESRKYGVKFVKASIPRIQEDPETHNLKIYMQDMLENCSEMREHEYDLVVLSSAMEPAHGIEILNEKLKLERSPDGFFKEYHARLNPVDTNTVGISLAGASQGPKSIAETIMQAKGAASSASIIMRPGEYKMRMEKAIVDEGRCSKCGLCVNNCPYKAITLEPVQRFAVVDEVKCRSCGICAQTCPSQAITVRNSRGMQFNAVIDNLLYHAVE